MARTRRSPGGDRGFDGQHAADSIQTTDVYRWAEATRRHRLQRALVDAERRTSAGRAS